MPDVTTSIIIDRSLRTVAEYAANPDNAPLWYENIKSVEWLTPRPLVLGTLLRFQAEFMRKKLSYIYQVVRFEPGKILVMRSADGPLKMKTSYVWEEIDEEHTRMVLNNKGEISGISKILSPLVSMSMKRENKKDLERIKFLLEKES